MYGKHILNPSSRKSTNNKTPEFYDVVFTKFYKYILLLIQELKDVTIKFKIYKSLKVFLNWGIIKEYQMYILGRHDYNKIIWSYTIDLCP